jgi:hypothetical protein
MSLTYRQAYELRRLQPGAMLPAPFHAMPTAELKSKADRERLAEEGVAGNQPAAPPAAIDPIDRALRRGPPKRPTGARLRTYFLRVFERCGSVALQRASGRDLEPRFYRGQQVATVERHNDRMLLRVLDRFDRSREREVRAAVAAQAARDMNAEVERRVAEQWARRVQENERYRADLERQFEERVAREVEKRISQMSPSTRLRGPAAALR